MKKEDDRITEYKEWENSDVFMRDKLYGQELKCFRAMATESLLILIRFPMKISLWE